MCFRWKQLRLQRRGSLQEFKSVVVTAGGDGVAYFHRSRRSVKLAGMNVVVESTHGAGDAFVGTAKPRTTVLEHRTVRFNCGGFRRGEM